MKVLTSAIVLLQLGGAVYSYDPDLFSEEEEGWERSAICHDGAVNMTTTGKHVPCNERDTVADNCIKKEGWSVIEEPYHTPEDQQKCICNSDLWKLWKGCSSCYRLHGGTEGDDFIRHDDLDGFSSAYCDNGPVTMAYTSFQSIHLRESVTVASTSNSDVLGTQTAMSLYYTGDISPVTTVAATVASATASATTTGAAPALRQDSGLLAPMAGLMVAVGLLA